MSAFGRPADEDGWAQLRAVRTGAIRDAVVDSFLPFWNRALDRRAGGVFTCWNNAGTELVRRDKYTWSQGRFLWLWSRVAAAMRAGLLPGSPKEYLEQAELTAHFLEEHAFLDNGDCAFLLAEGGEKLEPVPGGGFATSIFADCFVAMGLAEFARTAGDRARLARARQLFDRIESRIADGGFRSEPDPIPPGFRSHAIAMITLNVALVLSEASDALGDSRAAALRRRCADGAEALLRTFVHESGRLAELVPDSASAGDDLLSRHVNPGHALESLWVVMTVAAREGRSDWVRRALAAVDFAFAVGWDSPHGGLLHYADWRGGPPAGRSGGSRYERSVEANWDKKLWWVHSEAIYTALLAYRLDGTAAARAHFEQVFSYAFQTFPQPDPRIGEWIQIRNREGRPVEGIVALPVKDPYHIVRNLVMALEVLGPDQP